MNARDTVITGVEHLHIEILQDIRRMRGHDDETSGSSTRHIEVKEIAPSRPDTGVDKSASRTKAFQRRYVNMQRELQLPLKKSLTSRSPRVPDTSRSAPTDRTDNHNDNEAQHVNKQEVQRILGRLRKDREREKRKKEGRLISTI